MKPLSDTTPPPPLSSSPRFASFRRRSRSPPPPTSCPPAPRPRLHLSPRATLPSRPPSPRRPYLAHDMTNGLNCGNYGSQCHKDTFETYRKTGRRFQCPSIPSSNCVGTNLSAERLPWPRRGGRLAPRRPRRPVSPRQVAGSACFQLSFCFWKCWVMDLKSY